MTVLAHVGGLPVEELVPLAVPLWGAAAVALRGLVAARRGGRSARRAGRS